MKIRILGSAAGGGFPQWNCNCFNCHRMRTGAIRATPRTQSSIGVSTDNRRWVLLNTSPDIRAQLEAFPAILPRQGKRDTGVAAIIYMDSQLDHTTGLLMLREGCPHQIYCTDSVYDDLTTGFPVFRILQSWNGGIERHRIVANEAFTISEIGDLRFTPIPLTSKAPPYSPHRDNPQPGDNIGLVIEDLTCDKRVFYAPGLGVVEEHLMSLMREADCLLVDGTFWREDEMTFAGVGSKPASAMGHLPQSGAGGMIEVLNQFSKPRKILIHINNTNPILDKDSPERAELTRQHIEVAYDGMELEFSR
ncbi:MAG: pyrroloquinoline quinone biosynthesis protein PqqB [Cellvibrionaceae bacterium]|nr:pyrroloquinoline quinone biosynthesis protein PqqB [Cellvibrionaceae bacterium]